MREVAYSPLMATYLTFLESKLQAYTGSYPDENFAREIMQLFSVGLYRLRMDGTVYVDAAGEPLATYDNDDIMDGARLWTGFALRASRGNLEHYTGDNHENMVDPMKIVPTKRDAFPKMDLYDGHIGDGYPLCVELPPRAFLRKGARAQAARAAHWAQDPCLAHDACSHSTLSSLAAGSQVDRPRQADVVVVHSCSGGRGR